MAISCDSRLCGTFSFHPNLPSRPILSSSFKIQFGSHLSRGSNHLEVTPKWSHMAPVDHATRHRHSLCFVTKGIELSPSAINQDTDGFLLNAISMSFLERLNLAWRILFPTATARRNSNANIAKQRLKMILFSDRCAVSDEAKQKIVGNIVEALSDFVEIDSQDKVQLSVSTDPDHGTVYSVVVPVRRVKPEYQESDEDLRGIIGMEYKDTGETSGSVDVKFDFFVPNDMGSP